MTLLLSTHYMDEAEQLADYVYIIDQGKIVKEGSPQKLIGELGDDTIRLLGSGDTERYSEKIKTLPYVQSLNTSDDASIHVGVDSGQKRVPEILLLAEGAGFSVGEVEINRPNLGDVFFGATGREIRE
ncbi:MAG: hypothetical protein HN368_05450 [Spirochaetales bacterium]|jgi:ABC-2 type transport system ATP-binding protein|nr:hypothetical protein [Spirochaetales bacterium]